MMGYIWGGILLTAFLFAAFTGQTETVTTALFQGAEEAVTMALKLLGMMCFWSGFLEIADRAGITEKLSRLFRPVIKWLFPGLSPSSAAAKAMTMNITANLLGLSNAATPLGLTAMAELQKLNPHKETASDYMCTFVVINSAALCLMPTTLLTLRTGAGSGDPFSILVPVWICSLAALLVGISVAKVLEKRGHHL